MPPGAYELSKFIDHSIFRQLCQHSEKANGDTKRAEDSKPSKGREGTEAFITGYPDECITSRKYSGAKELSPVDV